MSELETSSLRAFGRGVADGLTGGYSPQIEAAIRAPFSSQRYSEIRDREIARVALHRREHPTASAAGQVTGVVGLTAIPVAGSLAYGTRAKTAADHLRAAYAASTTMEAGLTASVVSGASNDAPQAVRTLVSGM